MKKYETDTSEEYEDFVGYVSEDNLSKSSLGEFFGDEQEEYKPSVKPKGIDPDYPEDWQKLLISFETEDDIKEFTRKSGVVIGPKTTSAIYETDTGSVGLFNFLED